MKNLSRNYFYMEMVDGVMVGWEMGDSVVVGWEMI